MSRQNRREFLKKTVAASAAFSTFTISGTKSSGQVLGANDAIRIGVAGINGRGDSHISEFSGMEGVRITYLIDPDTRLFKKAKEIEKKTGTLPQTVQDVRKALEDKNLDAISIATPNHWHALMTIWACQAGKDVYVEKPCSHNVREGRIAVEAARRHGRIVQHGTQGRSGTEGATALAVAKSGQLGKLLIARGLCYKRRKSIGQKPNTQPPSELDFNIWLGPAEDRPYHENLVHYNWHWFWDTGNGDIGNQGVHQMDLARWGIPGATLPKSVISLGGRFGYEDQGETANTQITVMDFGETQLIFEVRGLETEPFGPLPKNKGVANVYHFEQGMIAGGEFFPKGATEPAPMPKVELERKPGNGHFGNFIAAVRSRRQEDLNADILEGHYSSALGHLANISYRLGEEVPFNKETKAFGDNKAAYETLASMEEHLTNNGLKLDGMKYRLGRRLEFDAKNETFVNDTQANELLTRNYRKPFVVEKIA